MVVGRTVENVQYYFWPDINYFPSSGNRDEDIFWSRFQIGMSWIVIPAVSLLGIAGNILNIAILVRGKLTKSSTWLILSLAVSDTIYLLGTNNIPIQLYVGEERQFGFDSRKLLAQTLFYVYVVQIAVELSSKVVAMTLPSLITFDRLVAVFLPFQYTRVMKVKRVLYVVGLLSFLATSYATFYSFKFDLSFTSLSKINTTAATNQLKDEFSAINDSYIGLIAPSTFYVENYALQRDIRSAFVYTYSLLPLFFTCFGCLAVGVRIRTQESKRRNLYAFFVQKTQMVKSCSNVCRCIKNVFPCLGNGSSSNKNSPHCLTLAVVKTTDSVVGGSITSEENRGISVQTEIGARRKGTNKTTRVLLSVCCMYCIANTINFTVLLFFNTANVSTGTAICLEMLRKFVLVLNSACNFLFYVGLNRNFKDSYRKLFVLCLTRALVKD